MKRMMVCLCVLCMLLSGAQAELKTLMPDWANGALQIPGSVSVIEDGAFQNIGADGVLIPTAVKSVEANAFAGNSALKRICVLGTNTVFGKNALGTKDEKKEIWGYIDSTAERYAEEYGYTFVRIYTYEEELMSYAASKLGTKYVRGSWDCVLYVRDCYLKAFNVRLPDTCRAMELLSQSSLVSSQKLTVTRITDISQLKTGDVLCWCNDEVTYCTHVGMYVGEGTVGGKHYTRGVFIENSNGFGGVRYNYLPTSGSGYYNRNFICAWRILP